MEGFSLQGCQSSACFMSSKFTTKLQIKNLHFKVAFREIHSSQIQLIWGGRAVTLRSKLTSFFYKEGKWFYVHVVYSVFKELPQKWRQSLICFHNSSFSSCLSGYVLSKSIPGMGFHGGFFLLKLVFFLKTDLKISL